MRPHSSRPRLRAGLAAGALGLTAAATVLAIPPATAHAATTSVYTPNTLGKGAIKHVWLIILENKSYDATETGLNNNTYLWKTLPSQGVLLTNYYGTGHTSQDNYESLVSGQGPSQDVQSDCDSQDYNLGSTTPIPASGTGGTIADPTSVNFGQVVSAAGPNAADGNNGCSYPTSTPTLFNQFDAAGVSWKGYAQDLGGASATSPTAAPSTPVGTSGSGAAATIDLRPGDGANTHAATAANGNSTTDTQDREASICGGPGSATNFPTTKATSPSTTGSTTTGSPSAYGALSFGSAQPDDQYVAKHFPFPWFQSLTGTSSNQGVSLTTPSQGGTDCDSAHIANLDSQTGGLLHDLSSESTTPAFSWITPDNCSDAHDATCRGNNLSGAFPANADGSANLSQPNYTPPAGETYPDPESTTPRNYTGGVYASDLFLAYYIPKIEASPAYKDGGLIDITWDEANPPYVNSSFNDQPTPGTFANSNERGTTNNAPGDNKIPANCNTATGTNTVIEPCTPSFGVDPATGTANTTGTSAYAPGADSVLGGIALQADAAGQTVNGVPQNTEPQGPNSPQTAGTVGTTATNGTKATGFGAGDNSFIHRTASNGSGVTTTSTHATTISAGSSIVSDPSIAPTQTGAPVTDANCGTVTAGMCADGFPAPAGGVFVGAVNNSGPAFSQDTGSAQYNSSQLAYTGSWQLVNQNGSPIVTDPSANTASYPVTFGAAVLPGTQTGLNYADPLFDQSDLTPGGGDTGSVLISPFITPGSSTSVYYNHYSWLKSMEDLFNVSSGAGKSADKTFLTASDSTARTVAGGLDNSGHLGFAAQPGLDGFGADVFNNPAGPAAALPEAPLALGLPLVGLAAVGAYVFLRRRQRHGVPA